MIVPHDGTLPEWVFQDVFPFGFAWDQSLRIVRKGRSLGNIIPRCSSPPLLDEVFELVRPAESLDHDWFETHRGILILLRVRFTELILRGQVLPTGHGGIWLFAGAPWIKTPEQLNEMRLSLADFAPHDSTIDLLYVNQAHRLGIRELKDLAARLRKTSLELSAQEQHARKLSLVAERTESGVIITDAESRIEWVNLSFERMSGWTLEEVRGRKPGSFLQGRCSDQEKVSMMSRLVLDGRPFHTELINYRKNGKPYWVEIEVQPIRDSKGSLTHFIALESDVTARKRQEITRFLESGVAEVIGQRPDLETIIPIIIESLALKLGRSRSEWWGLDQDGTRLYLENSWTTPELKDSSWVPQRSGLKLSKGMDLAGQAWAAWTSLWITDLSRNQAFATSHCGMLDDFQSALAIPVVNEHRLFGVLVLFTTILLPPDQESLEALNRIGIQIALLLRRIEAEAAYKKAEAIAHLGNWRMDVATGRIEWSDENFRIHGHAPQAFAVDMEFSLRAMHPEDVERISKMLADSMARGTPFATTYRIMRPDKEIRHLQACCEVLTDQDGRPATLIGTSLDITDLVQARSELQLTEQRWRLALQSNGLGVWDWEIETGGMIYSAVFLEILGYRVGDWKHHFEEWAGRVHPEDLPRAREAIQECLGGNIEEYSCEFRIRCGNGRWKWVQHVGRVVAFSKDGRPLRMVGTQMDIDIRRKGQEASRKRSELTNSIHNVLSQFIGANGLEPAFAQMLEIALAQTESNLGFIDEVLCDDAGNCYLLGLGGDPASLKEHVNRVSNPFAQAIQDVPSLHELIEAAMIRNEPFIYNPLEDGAASIAAPFSCLLGLPVVQGLEIVGLVFLANRPDGYDPDLIKELDPLCAAIAAVIVAQRQDDQRREDEARLRSALNRAEAANLAKNEFFGMMSHEVRTPMNGVLGMAGLLKEGPLDDGQLEMVDIILRSGKALTRILDDILNYSKAESGVSGLKEQNFSVEELLDGVVNLMAQDANSKGLELVTLIHPEAPITLFGDSGKVRQVLLNLVGNAIRFTDRGFVAIRVEPLEGDLEGDLEFSVVDSGIGIPSAEHERIFNPFFQIDSSSSRQMGGSGLGLAICKKLIELMNGQIGVTSEPVGSRFWFRIPSRAPTDPGSAEWPPRTKRIRIWIADPSPLIREAIQLSLKGVQEEFRVFSERERLFEIIGEHRPLPDVLFIDGDWMTPEEITVLADLCSGSGTAGPQVILTQGRSIKHDTGWLTLSRPFCRRRIREAVFPPKTIEHRLQGAAQHLESLGLKVLVAEDNEVNATLMTIYLERIGCEWFCVENGIEVVEKFKQEWFDAILMDCEMPIMDGHEATRHIRRLEAEIHPTRPPVRIIAVTANALEGERQRCLSIGMDEYISKPFDCEAVVRAIKG